jgi:pimeloyl-ACP methyl ester carboxylesterase
MRWLERGAGTPIVFVHGIPTSPELWRLVLPLVRSSVAR